LEAGADDYITKPFDADVLEARVHGVLALRQRLRRALRRQLRGDGEATGSPSLVADGPSEPRSSFEQEARSIIREHLTESSFDVDALAAAMAVSRTTLYRRANEADAPSPAALIRQVRMEQAAHLLRTGAGTVTEVAYAVGFDSLSSFSHQFRDHFDAPPSTYVA
jgi:AraC-like DNA-binding protein